MLKRVFCLWIACVAMSGAAFAQQPNPIVENYHAYMAALQRGDRVAAEAPAAAALAASQARDGDGGRTAVLAFNLARLRLVLAKYADAQSPAAIAARVAQAQGAASGVDPVLAQIVLGRADLGAADPAGADQLSAALVAAADRHDLDDDAYQGGLELGRWAQLQARYDIARTGYQTALDHVAAAPGDVGFARGVARVAVASSIILAARRPQLPEAMREAYPMLTQAAHELWPSAQGEGANGQLTPGQIAFARSLAWRAVAYQLGHQANSDTSNVQTALGGAVTCSYRPDRTGGDNRMYYPPSARDHGDEGTVVVRATFDENGNLTGTQVAASAPLETFSAAATSLVGHVRLIRDANAAPGCAMPHQVFFPVNFRLGG